MKKSKGMQLGAMLAALLIVSIAFVFAVSAQGTNEQTKIEKPGKIMTPDGYIMNKSDFDKAVIKRGTVEIPTTSSVAERVNATKNVMNQLWITLKVKDDESLDTVCNYSTNECTYRVSKHVKASADNVLPASNGWTERARDINSAGTTLFEGFWSVPSAPLDRASPLQTIFYFTALQDSENPGASILQPVLEWGQYGSYWDISSWYVIGGSRGYSDPINVNVGDSLYGYIQKQAGNQWLIYTYDIDLGLATSKYATTTNTFPNNYVALESYNVSTCRQFPGGNDFTNLNIAGRTPSWTSWINQSDQAFCGTLGIDIVSPSEVILKTGRMP